MPCADVWPGPSLARIITTLAPRAVHSILSAMHVPAIGGLFASASGLRIRFIAMLAACLTLATAQCVAAQRVGVLKNLEGEVTVLRVGQRQPALSGAVVQEGDRIITGAKGAAALTLVDGTVLTVGPNSSLDLTHHVYDPTSQQGSLLLNLLQGTLRMITGAMAKTNPELIKVTTPTAVVGVRGTDFIVEANP